MNKDLTKKEKAIFRDGTTGYIIPENPQLTNEFDGEWVCTYEGRYFEWHNNTWMEA